MIWYHKLFQSRGPLEKRNKSSSENSRLGLSSILFLLNLFINNSENNNNSENTTSLMPPLPSSLMEFSSIFTCSVLAPFVPKDQKILHY